MENERKNKPSASNMARYAGCPGCYHYCKDIPAPPETEDARFGTRVHAALAGEMPVADLSADEVDCVESCERLLAVALQDTPWANREDCDTVAVEKRLWEPYHYYSGKPDILMIAGSRAVVVDWKTGRGQVEQAAGNLQLRALAVLVAINYPVVQHVRCMIVQPYGQPQVSATDYTTADLETAEGEIISILHSLTPDAPRRHGEHCKYCPGLATCPEAQQPVQALARAAAGPVAVIPSPALLDACTQAIVAIEAIRKSAKAALSFNPGSIPGYRLKPGRRIETITQPQTVWERFVGIGGSAHQFLSCVGIGKGKLKDVAKRVTGAKGKALDAVVATLVEGCVEEKQAEASLEKIEGWDMWE